MRGIFFLILTLFSLKLFGQTIYPETFHDRNMNGSVGYWTFEKIEGFQIIDKSPYELHGYTKGSVFHEPGRKFREYPTRISDDRWVDSTGVTRTALNLNGGEAIIEGIPFYNFKSKFTQGFTLCFYIKPLAETEGVILSMGDSLTQSGLIIECKKKDSMNKYITFKFIIKDSVAFISENHIYILNNEWCFIHLYLFDKMNLRMAYEINKSQWDMSIHEIKSKFNYNVFPINLGYSGELKIGTNIFNGSHNSTVFSIDDVMIFPKYLRWEYVYDYINTSEKITNSPIKIYPIPSNGIITLNAEKLFQITNNKNYTIYNQFGQKMKTGQIENQINLSELPSNLYYMKIGSYTQRFQITK
jgi:hypothetical protein